MGDYQANQRRRDNWEEAKHTFCRMVCVCAGVFGGAVAGKIAGDWLYEVFLESPFTRSAKMENERAEGLER